jgi:hypothetical protein
MEIELSPPQPPEIERAVAELAGLDEPPVDPWWQAGLEDALAE